MKRKPAKAEARENAYRLVFMADPFMRNRLEVIMATGSDAFEGWSGSRSLEALLKGLVTGAPLSSMLCREDIVPRVREAIEQLFQYRDQGRFEVKHGH